MSFRLNVQDASSVVSNNSQPVRLMGECTHTHHVLDAAVLDGNSGANNVFYSLYLKKLKYKKRTH